MTYQAGSTDDTPWTSIAFSTVGVVAVAMGVVGLGSIGYWYAADMGWTGSGSTLVVSRWPIALTLLVAVLSVLLGAGAVLLRGDLGGSSLGVLLLLAAVAAMPIAVLVALRAYPQVEAAVLISHDGASWRAELPVTEVFGVRAETDRTITLEGRADRRACDWRLRAVTIDLDTGDVIDVTELPTSYPSDRVPPRPTPIDPHAFEIIPGIAPFICRS